MRVKRRFDCQLEAVTAARLFIRDLLRDQSLEVLAAAELITSELASNCVLHAHTDFELSVDANGQIRIEVSDAGEGRPRILSPTPRDVTGRGLRIVEAMSDEWGVTPMVEGKTVWFTLAKDDSPRQASGSRTGGVPRKP